LSGPYFYKGSGKGGKMCQLDYIKLLEVVTPHLKPNQVLSEDNDQSHRTKASESSQIQQTKKKFEVPVQSEHSEVTRLESDVEDLESSQTATGNLSFLPRNEVELKQQILYEWYRVSKAMCKKCTDELPERMREVIERSGDILPH
jgi:hypothetical protein